MANGPGAGLALNRTVNVRGRGTVTTAAFNALAGEQLVVFVSSDGTAGQTATVTGGGLTWTLAKRSNTQLGTSEIWVAKATTAISGVTVRSTQKTAGYDQSLTVTGFTGSAGAGATVAANALTGAPTASVVTTKAGSLVFGVGNDWDSAVARTLGSGQTMVNQWVDSAVGDTFWVQSRNAPTAAAGTSVAINDTAPTADRWNLAVVEILAG